MSKTVKKSSSVSLKKSSSVPLKKSSSVIFKKIADLGLFLSDRYQAYTETKKELINHPKIIEYLFNKPIDKISKLSDLLIDYDSLITKIVLLDNKDFDQLKSYFDTLCLLLVVYSEKHDEYEKCLGQIKTTSNKFSKINYLPKISDLSTNKQKIMAILDKLESQKKILYVNQWSFIQEGKNVSLSKMATVNYQHSFVYDFFGMIFTRGQMILFMIQYDDSTHFDTSAEKIIDIHITDLTIQYILFRINIHLLRLNKKSNFKEEIDAFLNRIKTSTHYVIQNPIRPIVKLFGDKVNDELVQFSKDYKYNHIIALKEPEKKIDKYDPDYIRIENQIDEDLLVESAPDRGTIISKDFINQILKEKKDLYVPHKTKYDRAEEYVVELEDKKNNKIDEKEIEALVYGDTSSKEDNLDRWSETSIELVKEPVEKNNFLDIFLKNYQPKVIDFTPYLKLDKLKGYKYMNDKDRCALIPTETYVKYILTGDAFINNKLKDHIHPGGLMLAGGTYVNKYFEKLDDPYKWTHLMLKRIPFPVGIMRTKKGYGYQNVYDYDAHVFYVKIHNYYIFYKYVKRE